MPLSFYARNLPGVSLPGSSAVTARPVQTVPDWEFTPTAIASRLESTLGQLTDSQLSELRLPSSVRDSTEFAINKYNNAVQQEQAAIDRDFQLSSARESMQFEAAQAAINRDFQLSSAREAMQFEAAQAQLSRDWQEQMSNTAYQRAVADLKAAGLNPALAYSNGGASSVAGASASGFTASGSSASGATAGGSRAGTDTQSVVDMIQTVMTNAKDERIAVLNALTRLAGRL